MRPTDPRKNRCPKCTAKPSSARYWIACCWCSQWHHCVCVGISRVLAAKIDWFCGTCSVKTEKTVRTTVEEAKRQQVSKYVKNFFCICARNGNHSYIVACCKCRQMFHNHCIRMKLHTHGLFDCPDCSSLESPLEKIANDEDVSVNATLAGPVQHYMTHDGKEATPDHSAVLDNGKVPAKECVDEHPFGVVSEEPLDVDHDGKEECAPRNYVAISDCSTDNARELTAEQSFNELCKDVLPMNSEVEVETLELCVNEASTPLRTFVQPYGSIRSGNSHPKSTNIGKVLKQKPRSRLSLSQSLSGKKTSAASPSLQNSGSVNKCNATVDQDGSSSDFDEEDRDVFQPKKKLINTK